jgi:hypothetical protein
MESSQLHVTSASRRVEMLINCIAISVVTKTRILLTRPGNQGIKVPRHRASQDFDLRFSILSGIFSLADY